MSTELKYCMGCMRSIPDDTMICPHCSYDENEPQGSPYLQKGSVIFDKYLVGRVLGSDPDTITYIGAQIETGETVTVHEFFPVNIAVRDKDGCGILVNTEFEQLYSEAVSEFIKLWNTINTFKDARCLPDVMEIFDFNGTVYSVCRYKDCIPLRKYFETTPPLTWDKAFSAFKPVMYTLEKLNQAGIVHCKLNPDTIHVGADGKLHITGFSIPQCYNGTEKFKCEPKDGFSPIELYSLIDINASTDVYGITAMLYYCITGTTPPVATQRVIQDTISLPASVAKNVTQDVITGLTGGLAVYSHNRYKNFNELIAALSPKKQQQTASAPNRFEINDKPTPRNKKEEVDMELAREEEERKRMRQEKRNRGSSASLGILAFLSGILFCIIGFLVLYSTVLYKNYPIDVLNKALSSFTFLPVNQTENVTENTTTAPPTATEPSYITVANFVNNHSVQSVKNNSFFTENYKIVFTERESADVPVGGIISQSLEPGSSVLVGTEIVLVISSGIKMPDVIGKNYKEAKKALEDRGLKVVIQVLQNKGDKKVGVVENANTPIGTSLEKGDTVVLNVWGTYATTTKPTTTAADTTQSTKPTKPSQEATTTTEEETTSDTSEE